MKNLQIQDPKTILHCKKEPGFLVKVLRVNGTIFEAEVVQFPENPIKYKNNTKFTSPRLKVGDIRLFENHNFEFNLQMTRDFIIKQLLKEK
jgi:hypothetical protein